MLTIKRETLTVELRLGVNLNGYLIGTIEFRASGCHLASLSLTVLLPNG